MNVNEGIERAAEKCINTRSRFWFSRTYVSLDVLATCGIGMFSVWGLNREAFVGIDGEWGWIVTALLAAMAIFAIIDVIFNDLLPDRFFLRRLRNARWAIFMAMSLGMCI